MAKKKKKKKTERMIKKLNINSHASWWNNFKNEHNLEHVKSSQPSEYKNQVAHAVKARAIVQRTRVLIRGRGSCSADAVSGIIIFSADTKKHGCPRVLQAM